MPYSLRQLIVLLSTLTLLTPPLLAADDGSHAHHDQQQGIGKVGSTKKITRTITITANDTLRFSPSNIKIKQGETIRFVVKNTGQLRHELVLGTKEYLATHAQVMLKNPAMTHTEPNMVSVNSGESASFVWQFTQAGEVVFGCLQPGHYTAGMKGSIAVL